MRPETPLSSPPPRLPVIWSASSTNTMTCPRARKTWKIFSRLPSVAPIHLSRKFLNTTNGTPTSPAKQFVSQVFPVPIRPVIR